jgi:signal peptidase I
MNNRSPTNAKRSLIIAIIMHLFIPGFGHYYNGYLKRGAFFFIFINSINFILFMMALHFENITIFIIDLLIPGCIWFYGLFDVITITKRNNIGCEPKNYNNCWYKYLIICLAVLIYYVITDKLNSLYVYNIIKAGGHSMENTLFEGDIIMIKRISTVRIKNNDLLDFNMTLLSNKGLLKRCIATEGQTIEIKNDSVFVDAQFCPPPPTSKLIEHYNSNTLDNSRDSTFINRKRDLPPSVIPNNYLYVMGDNRDNSIDSRYFGPISRDQIKGKLIFVLFSIDIKQKSGTGIINSLLKGEFEVRWNRNLIKLQ